MQTYIFLNPAYCSFSGFLILVPKRKQGCFLPCHRCIDNAIHSAAGMRLREECSHIMDHRRMKYVIHTVGPIVYGRLNDKLCQDLQNCYESVLQCCLEHHIESVAFCCISTGEFHFPNDKAAMIAWKTASAFLEKHGNCLDRAIFNVFKDSDLNLYKNILADSASVKSVG